ncbi:MAG: GNAT family N-acetyltransferase [Anaerolineae bacterium]|nr:GNAT family N-acetyltransferase [Anaerolineae bacterium]
MYKEGKQIQLRDMQAEDVEEWARWQTSDAHWKTLDAPYYHQEESRPLEEIAQEQLAKLARNADRPRPHRVAAIARAEDNSYLGMVSWYWISQETYWPALGIVIYDPANWGKGYGYEALGLWSQYLLDANTQFVRLDLRTWSGNKGMMRLAEKVGYMLEARFRKARIVNEQYYDGIGYGLLRDEWQQRYPQGFAAAL